MMAGQALSRHGVQRLALTISQARRQVLCTASWPSCWPGTELSRTGHLGAELTMKDIGNQRWVERGFEIDEMEHARQALGLAKLAGSEVAGLRTF